MSAQSRRPKENVSPPPILLSHYLTRFSDDTLEQSVRLAATLQAATRAAGVAEIGQRVAKSIDLMRTVALFATRTTQLNQ